MRILIQECLSGLVKLSDGKTVSKIERGEVIFVSFTIGDDKKIIDKMIDKLLKARIFPDSDGKTNLTIQQFQGEFLIVPQFTLYASLKGGNRPSFTGCLEKEKAKELYDYFSKKMSLEYDRCKFGVFHADMKVHLINDGPFTILLDSEELFK